jgi:CRISPR-associated protein Csm5
MQYKVQVKTLTPLHIGSGTELIKGFDYVSPEESKTTYVLDQDAIYADELAKKGETARLGQMASSLLGPYGLDPGSRFVRYKLQGQAQLERLHEQMKDLQGRVYLPGSSLKGAIRNALMTYAITRQEFDTQRLKSEAKYAAHDWERQAFGYEPQYDLLRILQVADSAALPLEPSPLQTLPVQVFTQASDDEGSPIEVEAVSAGVTFVTTITLDELTLRYADDPRLDWEERLHWLFYLLPILQAVSQRRIDQEYAVVQARGFERAVGFYADLKSKAELNAGGKTVLMQIAWGTGWSGMTIAPALDQAGVNYLRRRYKLGKPPEWDSQLKGEWKPDFTRPYPKSRRLQVERSDNTSMAGQPLGWVEVTIEPQGEPRRPEAWAELQEAAKDAFREMGDKAKVAFPQEIVVTPPEPPTPIFVLPSRPPAPTTMVASFNELPKIGDGFEGVMFTDEGDEVLLVIPGLDPDTQAYAVLKRGDNRLLGKTREEQVFQCQVMAIEEDEANQGCVRVVCLIF